MQAWGNKIAGRYLAQAVNQGVTDADKSFPSRSRGRDVYIIHWGVKPSGGNSFHYCLLIADVDDPSLPKHPTSLTVGVVFSWGSFGGRGHSWDNLVKHGGKSRRWMFDWEKEVAGQNTYEHVGSTMLSDDEIAAMMDRHGHYYNIVVNNCRQVTTNVAKVLCGQVTEQQLADYIQHMGTERD